LDAGFVNSQFGNQPIIVSLALVQSTNLRFACATQSTNPQPRFFVVPIIISHPEKSGLLRKTMRDKE
jgi:hypothetical protein